MPLVVCFCFYIIFNEKERIGCRKNRDNDSQTFGGDRVFLSREKYFYILCLQNNFQMLLKSIKTNTQ